MAARNPILIKETQCRREAARNALVPSLSQQTFLAIDICCVARCSRFKVLSPRNSPSTSTTNANVDVCTCPEQGSVWVQNMAIHVLWSCLATFLACSWASLAHAPIRPVPSSDQPRSRFALALSLRRVGWVCGAIVVPEMVILWALRASFHVGSQKSSRPPSQLRDDRPKHIPAANGQELGIEDLELTLKRPSSPIPAPPANTIDIPRPSYLWPSPWPTILSAQASNPHSVMSSPPKSPKSPDTTMVYSSASSRTQSTDYGIYTRRMGVSLESLFDSEFKSPNYRASLEFEAAHLPAQDPDPDPTRSPTSTYVQMVLLDWRLSPSPSLDGDLSLDLGYKDEDENEDENAADDPARDGNWPEPEFEFEEEDLEMMMMLGDMDP